MPTPGALVLSKMLDRLLAGVMSGPNMNCRPARSRQRVDLTHLARLGDKPPVEALNDLLGPEQSTKLVAKIKPPKKQAARPVDPGADHGDSAPLEPEPKDSPYAAQSALLTKVRVIADDAKTYENDTGVAALNVGFPLLSVPPTPAGPGQRPGRRILAPIAFIPVNLSVKAGAKPSVEIACRGEAAERVRPNEALLAWIEQQTGIAAPPEADATIEPWTEICGLVAHVAKAMHLEVPPEFQIAPRSPGIPGEARGSGDGPRAGRGEGDFGSPTALVEPNHPDPQPQPQVHPEYRQRGPDSSDKPVLSYPQEPDSSAPDPVNPPPTTSGTPTPARTIPLTEAPRPDDNTAEPAIVIASVMGLFPTAHQGLIRDTRALAADPAAITDGPIRPFLTAGIDFDAPAAAVDLSTPQEPTKPKGAALLAAAADPCQAAAVALARDCSALVVHGPPGTGKSQTITNIIADHLARGQRVLLVCEKRTALDVVADRLDHLGLRQFCGIVHDPQHDQRDLYKSVKDQLDELAGVKTDPDAGKKLEKIEADLATVHGELSTYLAAVAAEPKPGQPSFHDLVGAWLTADGDHPVAASEAVAAVPVVDLNHHRAALIDLFTRADSVGYSRNPWTKCAGIPLPDFLARPMSDWRTLLDRLTAATDTADAAASPDIPPFSDSTGLAASAGSGTAGKLITPQPTISPESLAAQAAARVPLADRIESEWPDIEAAGIAAVASPDRKPTTAVPADIDLIRTTPIEPAFVGRIIRPPAAAEIEQTRAVLTEYRRAADKWTAAFAFKAKSAATAALQPYGLPLSVDAADRVLAFLAGVSARTRVHRVGEEFLGKPPGPIPADDDLLAYDRAAASWNKLISDIAANPATASVLKRVVPNLDLSALLNGLRQSPARADAVIAVHGQIADSGLFDQTWVEKIWADLLGGTTAGETVRALVDRIDTLEGVLRVRTERATLPDSLGPVVDTLLARVVNPDQAITSLQRSSVEAEIRRRLSAQPMLLAVDARRIESLFDQHRSLQNRRRDAVRETIRHHWIGRQKQRLLNEAGTKRNSLATNLSGRLITRGERAVRLREVIRRGAGTDGGDPLLDLRPVWMASPETVAQIFPLAPLFDVVVFDEASQCRLEEALPVLTRGKRVVVAGDPHQLPPTRFFESAVVQSDDDEPESDQELFEHQQGQIEDLLAAALNLSIVQSYLDVHYRSRYADLIQFSNEHFYRRRLQPLPAHPSRRPAVSPVLMHRVPGLYQHRRNDIEALKVVEIVRQLLDQPDPPSIGIACLNLPQRDLIVERLDEAAGADADFAKKLAAARARRGTGSSDGLFVKNLENVQGDERDDIIISTTYGPDPAGKFHRRFGPVGMAGGGRRLNVLVTRARNRVHLVTSIPVNEYATLPPVPDGSAPTGAWLLFAYLQYADRLTESYTAPAAAAAGSAVSAVDGSALIKGLAARLANRWSVVAPWGDDGFGIDLAITPLSAPDRPAVGVLCDAPRPPAAIDVVDWDVFRTGVLATAGWSIRRIWSPHFFRDPAGQIARLSE